MKTFAKDVTKLASGTMFAQILTIVVSPIVTRLYSPEDYGTMALFVSIVAIVGLIACLSYEFAIVLPEKE